MADNETTLPTTPGSDWSHPINTAALEAGLRAEFASATTNEHKKAIKAALEQLLGGGNTSEDRSDVETASGRHAGEPTDQR